MPTLRWQDALLLVLGNPDDAPATLVAKHP